jgi:hypothetical protein
MSKVRRMLVALVAASLMVGLAAPVAGAQKKSPSNKQLDAKLNSTRKSLGKTNRSLKSTRTSLAATQGQVTDAVRDIGALTQRVAGTEGGLKGLLEAAPTLVKNLTDLGTAVRDTIGPGLTALQAALKNDVAPALTALQTGLQTLGGSVQTLGGSVQTIGTNLGTLSTTVGAIGSAVNNPTTGLAALNQRAAANEAEEDAKEYGVARVFRQAAGAGPLTALGTVWTPDIPDDGSNAAGRQRRRRDALRGRRRHQRPRRDPRQRDRRPGRRERPGGPGRRRPHHPGGGRHARRRRSDGGEPRLRRGAGRHDPDVLRPGVVERP